MPGKHDSQTVNVLVNDQLVGRWEIAEHLFHTQQLKLPTSALHASGPTRFKFEFPDARSPASLGESEDTRQLGLAFRRLRVTELDASER